jgi:hypothetical protein
MKYSHKDGVAVNAKPRLVAIRFEIDPPAAIYISVRAAQRFDALLPAEQPRHPRAYYEWMPNPYAWNYSHLRVASADEGPLPPAGQTLF